MCALSFLSLERAAEHLDPHRVLQMIALMHEAHAVMCEGQSLDLRFESEAIVDARRIPSHDRLQDRAALRRVVPLGRARGRMRDEPAIAGYGDVGRAYGMAFQIRDDVSGIWSSVDETGKITGSDVARRKWTFPVVWAIAQPRSPARDAVAERVRESAPARAGRGGARDRGARRTRRARGRSRAAAEHVAVIERHRNAEFRDFLLRTLDLTARVRGGADRVSVNGTVRPRDRPKRYAPGRCPRWSSQASSYACFSSATKVSRPTCDTFEVVGDLLAAHGFANFYGTGGFADYPPGYFYILGIVGWTLGRVLKSTDGGHYTVLKALVKLPAILADLGIGVLVYASCGVLPAPA